MIGPIGFIVGVLFVVCGLFAPGAEVLIFGGIFFFALSIGTLYNKKYMYLFIAFAILSMIVFQIFTGEAFNISRTYPRTYLLSENPSGFWSYIVSQAILVIICFCIGLYKTFFEKKPANIDTDEFMQDLESAANLITETKTANELRVRAQQLFQQLEIKYEGNEVGQLSLKASKDGINDEIEKRMANESK